MSKPPSAPRSRPVPDQPTWRAILVSYAAMVAIPLALWFVSRPLAGTVVVAALVGLLVGARRAYALTRCFRDCRGFAFDLAGKVRITVTPPPAADDSA